MIEPRELDDDGVSWMKCHLESLDILLNMVIEDQITNHDFTLYIWIASFCWKSERNKRNPCLKSPQQMAKYFEVSKETIAKRLKRLRQAGLIETKYRVYTNGAHYEFDSEKKSWKFRKENGGQIVSSIQYVKNETFTIDVGKDGQKFKRKASDS